MGLQSSLVQRLVPRSAVLVGAVTLAGCATVDLGRPEVGPTVVTCPNGVPAGARCLRGQDSANAHYLIVVPQTWSGILVVHARGGPSLGTPTVAGADADIRRWAIAVQEGHAWAGSVYRQGGFAVTAAAEDIDRVRRIFLQHVAKPRRTLLFGVSWGAMVATRAAELFPGSWDGMLLTNGVVAGPGTYDFRLDLRALYQHLCNNHPRPDEPAYPLAIGLPADARLTAAELATRMDDCLGVRKPAAQRTLEQANKLKTIVDVIRTPENSIAHHLYWGTFVLRDVVARTGASPFGNSGVRYVGSDDDEALNAAIARFTPDPKAVEQFAADSDHRGRFAMPVLTVHGIGDATVFVEGNDTLKRRMNAAGNGAWLVQTFIDSSDHAYLGHATYPPLFEALVAWVDKGEKPTPKSIDERCRQLHAAAAGSCAFRPEYTPQPLAARIPPR